jgi:Skp family chaperone for outer membrane proteins
MHAAAVRVRQMVGAGGMEMTAGQLLAMFDREDVQGAREEIADELFTVGLITRPSIVHSMPNEKVKITTPDEAADHMLRNGIIWAILLPIVGVIWAIRLFARERVGAGFAVLATAILVVLIYFYALGAFDKPLSSIGLNVHECARNGLGQTFCGKELTEQRERVNSIKQSTEESQKKLEESEAKSKEEAARQQAKSEEEIKAQQAKSEQEAKALQQRSEEEIRRSQEGAP